MIELNNEQLNIVKKSLLYHRKHLIKNNKDTELFKNETLYNFMVNHDEHKFNKMQSDTMIAALSYSTVVLLNRGYNHYKHNRNKSAEKLENMTYPPYFTWNYIHSNYVEDSTDKFINYVNKKESE